MSTNKNEKQKLPGSNYESKGSCSLKFQSDGDCPENIGVRIPYQLSLSLFFFFLDKEFHLGGKMLSKS